MKRLLMIAAAALATTACAGLHHSDENPYENPFYAKYLNTGSSLDAAIHRTMEQLRENPDSAELHNTLGALLLDKGFPKDAEREFERAADANGNYYQAWYNLGLVRASRGDEIGASRAFRKTVDVKPGHSQALFQLGLVEEKNHHKDKAVRYYAKAFTINPSLLRVDVNPRIVDTKLVHLAMLTMYESDHARRTTQFQGTALTPLAPSVSTPPPAASPQPDPKNIVTPAPPATQVGAEPTPVTAPGSAPASEVPFALRGRRGRSRTPPAAAQAPAPATDETAVPATPPPSNQ